MNLPPDYLSPPAALPVKPFEQRYLVISKLGSGSFGTVVLAKNVAVGDSYPRKVNTLMQPINGQPFNGQAYSSSSSSSSKSSSSSNNNLVAIKTMTKRLSKLKDYTKIKEVKFILAMPSHANLVFVHEMFIDSTYFQLHIVMETMDQNLYQLMKARRGQLFSAASTKSILAQVLAAVRHIHRHGYFHRDLKPENILVSCRQSSGYTVKLADYGLARSVANKKPYTAYISTRWYRSPEILLRQNHYSQPVDMWAFGAVAAEVASFRPLFPGSNELDQTCKILDVLGTPNAVSLDGVSIKPPGLGGYWPKASKLAANLGFILPYKIGLSIGDIVPRADLAPLRDVIKACLTWDPSYRVDAETLCRFPFFERSVVNPHEEAYVRYPSSSLMSSPSRASSLSLDTPKTPSTKSPSYKVFKSGLKSHHSPQFSPSCDSASDSIMSKYASQVAGLRNSYPEYCSSIESVDLDEKGVWVDPMGLRQRSLNYENLGYWQ